MYINQELGKIGEDIATSHLKKLNYKIIERNFRTRTGEIDIIAKDKNELVFVEVKTRTTTFFGNPAEAVNFIKKEHIYKTAKYYLYKNKLENAFVRFDVIEIYFNNNKYKVVHLKNIEI